VVDDRVTYSLEEGVACSLARTAYQAAGLLQSHMDPESSAPWELGPSGNTEILQLISDAIGMLASCVSKMGYSAEGTIRDRHMNAALYAGVASTEVAKVIEATVGSRPETGSEPGSVNQPAQLASKSFGKPGLGEVMQFVGMIPTTAADPARTLSAGLTPGAPGMSPR
jgi:hypothetical protein